MTEIRKPLTSLQFKTITDSIAEVQAATEQLERAKTVQHKIMTLILDANSIDIKQHITIDFQTQEIVVTVDGE